MLVAMSTAFILPAYAYDHEGLALAALEHHIRPGYAAFATAANGLRSAAADLCAAPAPDKLSRARDAFKLAAFSWARIEHLNFGPVAESKRHERLVFWPDPKGLGRKQVTAIIETADETAFDGRLAGKSIAVQGLTALDIVLFGDGSNGLEAADAKGSPRCRYAAALTSNIDTIARETSAAWAPGGAYEATWLKPGADNAAYLSPKETTQALLQSYVSGTEMVRDQRLKGQLGMQKIGAKALIPMFPNSQISIAYMRANIEGQRALLDDGGFIARQTDPPMTDRAKMANTVLGSINEELTRAIEASKAAEKASPEPFADDAARTKLIAMGFPLKNAYVTGGQTIADQAGITLGFSALDGD